MDANVYQKLALRTEKTPRFVRDAQDGSVGHTQDQTARLLHAMLGISSEAGELADALKKHLIYGAVFDPVNVMEECGDLLWYIALALHATGYTMSDAMERNIAKLRRRYPQGFTEEKALTRDLAAERMALARDRMICKWCHQSESNHRDRIGAAADCTFEPLRCICGKGIGFAVCPHCHGAR